MSGSSQGTLPAGLLFVTLMLSFALKQANLAIFIDEVVDRFLIYTGNHYSYVMYMLCIDNYMII